MGVYIDGLVMVVCGIIKVVGLLVVRFFFGLVEDMVVRITYCIFLFGFCRESFFGLLVIVLSFVLVDILNGFVCVFIDW